LADLAACVGQEVAVSDWITITQEQVNLFAEATGDHQWIHVDVERAGRALRRADCARLPDAVAAAALL
jgi:acyl dehydratase